MEWSEGVWDSEKRNTNCLPKKMTIKQETVKLSISDDCNGHDDDVDGYDYENDKNVKNKADDDDDDDNNDNDYHDNDDDDDDDYDDNDYHDYHDNDEDDYDDNDYHDYHHNDDDDDDDDKMITISNLNKRKPACQLLSSLMSRYRKV